MGQKVVGGSQHMLMFSIQIHTWKTYMEAHICLMAQEEPYAGSRHESACQAYTNK